MDAVTECAVDEDRSPVGPRPRDVPEAVAGSGERAADVVLPLGQHADADPGQRGQVVDVFWTQTDARGETWVNELAAMPAGRSARRAR
ncbi:MAG: hypothetical protein GEV28_04860 [Actinophytocola sp.]|nr:hypothetical protein [Actinophytocola sp.]